MTDAQHRATALGDGDQGRVVAANGTEAAGDAGVDVASVFGATSVGIAICDLEGRFRSVNPALARQFGVEAARLVGRSAVDLLPAAEVGVVDLRADGEGRGEVRATRRVERPDGRTVTLDLRLTTVDDAQGRPMAQLCLVVPQETAGEDRYRELVEDAPHAFLVESGGRIIYSNQALADLLGTESSADQAGRSLSDFVHPAALEDFDARRREGWAQAYGTERPAETTLARADGAAVSVSTIAKPVTFDGKPSLYVILWDISKHKVAEQHLTHQATHDPLTGLPNRLGIGGRIDEQLADQQANGRLLALMMVDLDGFKRLNDSIGHSGGDAALVAAAKRLRQAVRPADTVVRLGGDEFLLLCGVESADDARAVAERVHRTFGEPFSVEGSRIRLGASIGIALSGQTACSAIDLLRRADEAAYGVKAAGGGDYRLWSAS